MVNQFSTPDEYSETEQQLGYEAGYRGDELLDGHSDLYKEYYDIGAATKANLNERPAGQRRLQVAGDPSRNGHTDLRRNRGNDPRI